MGFGGHPTFPLQCHPKPQSFTGSGAAYDLSTWWGRSNAVLGFWDAACPKWPHVQSTWAMNSIRNEHTSIKSKHDEKPWKYVLCTCFVTGKHAPFTGKYVPITGYTLGYVQNTYLVRILDVLWTYFGVRLATCCFNDSSGHFSLDEPMPHLVSTCFYSMSFRTLDLLLHSFASNQHYLLCIIARQERSHMQIECMFAIKGKFLLYLICCKAICNITSLWERGPSNGPSAGDWSHVGTAEPKLIQHHPINHPN